LERQEIDGQGVIREHGHSSLVSVAGCGVVGRYDGHAFDGYVGFENITRRVREVNGQRAGFRFGLAVRDTG
jgi:hypothetical protein